ncbi:glutathione S- transferase, nitrogen catabolite repression regulator [Tulasnella sp. 331]|nr:glutathione S- transferase, nitrogen catabolite repression regulator [Tulasnella sp. 331]
MSTVVSPSFQFYTQATPNGHKVSVLLEELKATYGIRYTVRSIELFRNEQKQPWFVKINPNGRIPAIVDETRKNFNVFESAAILLYLTQHYDPEYKFMFDPVRDSNNYSEALQWIFLSHGGIGPMQGQAAHFVRFSPEKIPYATARYQTEIKRLYSVLESRLTSRDYLVGDGRGRYSIADMNCFPWYEPHRPEKESSIFMSLAPSFVCRVRAHAWCGIPDSDMKEFPNIDAWIKRCEERPATYEGLGIPKRQSKMTEEEMEGLAEKARGMFNPASEVKMDRMFMPA